MFIDFAANQCLGAPAERNVPEDEWRRTLHFAPLERGTF